MVKLTTTTFLVAALTLASSPSLAAPMPITAPETDSSASVEANGDGVSASEDPDQLETRLRMLIKKDEVPDSAAKDCKSPKPPTSSDNIRRSIPLLATGNNFIEKRESLSKRGDIVTGLGLGGALAPLGLGGLLPTLEGAIAGLPILGGPVSGLLTTLDSTVGISSLLNPVVPAARKPSKRQLSPDQISGLLGGLSGGVNGASSPLGGIGGDLSGQLGGVAQAGYGATGSSAAIGALLGQLQGLGATLPANPLSGLSIAQAEALGLLPAGFTHNLAMKIIQHEDQTQQSGFANQFIETANEYRKKHHPMSSSTSTSAAHKTQHQTSGMATSTSAAKPLATTPTAEASLPTAVPKTPAAPEPAVVDTPTPAVVDPEPAAAEEDPAPDAADEGDDAQADAPDPQENVVVSSTTSHAPMATSTPILLEPQAVSSATATSTMVVGKMQMTDGHIELAQRSYDDSESDYSDDSSDDEVEVTAHRRKGNVWKVTTCTGSSGMAQTASQANATAEAMSMTPSDLGSVAVPTTTGTNHRWARNLD